MVRLEAIAGAVGSDLLWAKRPQSCAALNFSGRLAEAHSVRT